MNKILKTGLLTICLALCYVLIPLSCFAEEVKKNWIDPVTGMEFVWIPQGCYQMGYGEWIDNEYFITPSDDETLVHKVCLDGFWLGKNEVTQAQWQKVMRNNPSYFKSGDNYPVERVSWNDCQEFITRLNYFGKQKFRLPTEAEWEYAARSGGKNEIYAGGSDRDKFTWFLKNSDRKPHEAGTKAPNGLGFHDMSGNVSEWCQDVYDSKAYSRHSKKNPLITSGSIFRVFRGGDMESQFWSLCTMTRYANTVDGNHNAYQGLRLCLSKIKE